MIRFLAVVIVASVALVGLFAAGAKTRLAYGPAADGLWDMRPVQSDQPAALGGWMFEFFKGRRRAASVVTLQIPARTSGPVVPPTVSTPLAGAREFHIDVDLNHDGVFEGRGERGYAEGRFDATGSAMVRLHGLVAGRYEARVRFRHGGDEVLSPVAAFEVATLPDRHLPVSFEPNVGQADPEVLFLGRARGQTVFITAEETALVGRSGNRQRFRLVGANSWVRPVGEKKLPGIRNYFIGDDPTKWRTEIPTFAELITRDVYPGIDLVCYSNEGRLQYDFRVAPGADPSLITLDFPEADELAVGEDGRLMIRQANGYTLHQSAPVLYQTRGAERDCVKGRWCLKGRRQAAYEVADFDRSRELVIDPIFFATYFGGNGLDAPNAIALDSAGNIYLTGMTDSFPFPGFPSVGAPQTAPGGSGDVFIMKMNSTGTAVLYATYIGAGGTDSGIAIAVDAAGNAYVTGLSQGGFPITPGAFRSLFQIEEAFVLKLNPAGTTLLYCTYLGGKGAEWGSGIAIDAAGNAYITGRTDSTDFPTTPGAFQPAFGGGIADDVFVTKMNPTGTAVIYSTFVGGGGADQGQAIVIDAAGNAYVTGQTTAAGAPFPTTPGAFQTVNAPGNTKAFAFKVNPGGTALLYSTFLGGTNPPAATDVGNGIALDAAGNVYIGGTTAHTDFPTTPGAYQTSYQGGGNDAFVTKLNLTGTALVYSTFVGSAGNDLGLSIALDGASNAYLCGWTTGATFPQVNAVQPTFGGGQDAFVCQLNAAGTNLAFSTYLGGPKLDSAAAVALDASGVIHIAGRAGDNFPVVNALQPIKGGGIQDDMLIAKLTPGPGVMPPAGGGGSPGEGTYIGSGGPPNAVNLPPGEGAFGFGGMKGAPKLRLPVLRGPVWVGAANFHVFNVAHEQANAKPDAATGWAPLGCVSIAILALALIAMRVAKYRST